jgi:hypothetical protein
MKFSAFDGTQRFITVLCLKQHANGPYCGSVEYAAYIPLSSESILSFYLHHISQVVPYLQIFPMKSCMHFNVLPRMPMSYPQHTLLDHPNNVWTATQIMKLLMTKLYSIILLLPLKFKYTPGHPVLHHPATPFSITLPPCSQSPCSQSPCHPVLNHPQFMCFPNVRAQASNPHKKNGKKWGQTCCCDA